MSERALVTVREIAEIKPIPGADLIAHYRVDGWWVVDKKGLYSVGDLVLYFEVDSWVPHTLAPFLSKGKEPREYEGVIGERLRTIKLRGVISQGLLLPLSAVKRETQDDLSSEFPVLSMLQELMITVGHQQAREKIQRINFTDLTGVIKWEPPIPAELAGQVEGEFPSYIPKTDQERIQNIDPELIFVTYKDNRYERTGKLEGTSTTYFKDPNTGGDGICSRNWRLKNNEANASNTLVKYYNDHKIAEKLTTLWKETGHYFALQGEMCGPGIQENYERLSKHTFFIYYIWDITEQEMLTPTERDEVLQLLNDETIVKVPLIDSGKTLEEMGIYSIDDLLKAAEGPSINNPVREGIVYKHMDSKFSFKTISNAYLLQKGK